MGDHKTYEESIKSVYYGLGLLAVITLIEVGVSLFGKGHLWAGAKDTSWAIWVAGILIVVLSIYKAYFIIYEFMHMGYEVKGLAMSVLLPTLLLVWGIIAFLQEGDAWKNSRELIQEKNEMKIEDVQKSTSYLNHQTISLDEAIG